VASFLKAPSYRFLFPMLVFSLYLGVHETG
jgi:hypothetical protein